LPVKTENPTCQIEKMNNDDSRISRRAQS